MIPPLLELLPPLLLFSIRSNFTSRPPTMIPNDTTITIREGGTLELECTGYKPIDFYRDNVKQQPHNATKISETYHTAKFVVANVSSSNVGFYGCAFNDTKVEYNTYNQTDVSRIYVFVELPKIEFLSAGRGQTLVAYEEDDVLIPCRPTSQYPVFLQQGLLYKIGEDRTSFDPKFGYTLKNISLHDSRHYMCVMANLIDNAYYGVFIDVIPKFLHSIITHGMEYPVTNTTYTLKCKVIMKDMPNDTKLTWMTPLKYKLTGNKTFRRRRLASRTLKSENAYVTQVISALTISGIRSIDAGNYTCKFSSSTRNSVKHININVYDSDNFTINLIPVQQKISARNGENVTIEAIIDTKSPLAIKWRTPSDYSTLRSRETNNSIQLFIINANKSADMGQYELVVSNKYHKARLYFTVEFT